MSAKDQIKQIVDYFKREPQLKDKTDGMAEGLLLGAQLADDANELSKETDASLKALQREYTENGNGSQTTAEITVARDGELVLDDRLKRDFGNVNAQLARTMTQTEFDSWVASLLDGGPSIFRETLQSLITEFPNGAPGVALIRETDPSRIYVWNGTAWQDFGAYQGMEWKEGIAARTDNKGNVFPLLKDNIDNAYSILESNHRRVTFGDWVSGAIQSDGTENELNTYLKSSDYHTFPLGTVIQIRPLKGFNLRIAEYSFDGVFISTSAYFDYTYKFYPKENHKYKFSIGYDQTTPVTIADIGNIVMSEPFNIETTVKGANYINENKNLLDPDTLLPNTVINADTGLPEPSSAYGATGLLPFYNGQDLYSTPYRNFVLYDRNGDRIGATATEATENTKIVTTNDPRIQGIRFTYRIENFENAMVSHTPITEYQPYGYKMRHLLVDEHNLSLEAKNYIASLAANPLQGKSLYSFGTSILAGHHAGVSFPDYVAENNGMAYTKYAKNGSVVIGTGTDSIIHQISNASAELPDVIVMDSWANNAYTSVTDDPLKLGTITPDYESSFDLNTYCGGLENIFKTLQTKYQGVPVLHIAVHKLHGRDKGSQEKLYDLTKQICQKWSIAFLDMYNESNLNTYLPAHREAYSYDAAGTTTGGSGTHLNEIGNKKVYVSPVTAKLKTLL